MRRHLVEPGLRDKVCPELSDPQPQTLSVLFVSPAKGDAEARHAFAAAGGLAARALQVGRRHGRRRLGSSCVRQIESPRAAIQLMKFQSVIDPLPEVAVFHRHHLTEMFPLPAVLTPFRQAVGNSAIDVSAGRNERDARRLGQRLQTTHDGQQLEPLALHVWFGVFSFKLFRSVERLKHKPPLSLRVFPVRFRKQKEMRRGRIHRG